MELNAQKINRLRALSEQELSTLLEQALRSMGVSERRAKFFARQSPKLHKKLQTMSDAELEKLLSMLSEAQKEKLFSQL